MSPPIFALIWVHGLYLVLTILLNQSRGRPIAEQALVMSRWCYGLAVPAILFWLLSRIGRLAEDFLSSLSHQVGTAWDAAMLPLMGHALRRILPLVAILMAPSMLPLSPGLDEVFGKMTSLLLIGAVASLLYQVVEAGAGLIVQRYRTEQADNLQARAVQTQVMVLKKVAVALIGVLTLASMLMVFQSARQFGANILASAGIAGIVVGLAAQRSIATLLAGFQIALTQPIRVDDVVIVENEWGRIEEITLTYVVVRIWDLRRLIVPITHFIEKPFQNWTRSSSDLLATVFLYVDYTVPLDEVRAELTRVLQASTRWDGKVNVLQVTDAKEHTLEIRALASAANSSIAWDLRCEVRENLVAFLQRHYPHSLPRIRAAIGNVPVESVSAIDREQPPLAAAEHSSPAR